LSSIGSALGSFLGVGSAKAGELGPQNSGIAAVQDAAIAAAKTGQLDSFLANNFTAAAVLSTNPANLSELQAQNSAAVAALAGSPTGGATLGSWTGSKTAETAPTAADPYGSLTMSPEQAKAAELSGQIAAIGANPATATGFTAAPAAPSAPSQVAAAPALSPESPTTSLTIGRDAQPTAMSSTSKSAPTYTGIDAIDSRIDKALANPGTTLTNAAVGLVPGVGLVNSISGLLGGPTVGGVLADVAGSIIGSGGKGAGQTGDGTGAGGTGNGPGTTTATTNIQDSLSGGGNDSGADTGTDTGGTDTLPGGGTDTTPKKRIISGREYVGGVDPAHTYGSRGETLFFRPFQKEVTAADGGYFDADSYFSDGGLMTPSSPPSMPTMSSFPTMAFTDGQGPVGNIAQPPGLLPSDSVGSDAPHASPMAPSPAAASPSTSTLQQTLGARNTNASPAMAPVPQNPNVGYALGQSPLSNLRNS
jgi:hypothetical protein